MELSFHPRVLGYGPDFHAPSVRLGMRSRTLVLSLMLPRTRRGWRRVWLWSRGDGNKVDGYGCVRFFSGPWFVVIWAHREL